MQPIDRSKYFLLLQKHQRKKEDMVEGDEQSILLNKANKANKATRNTTAGKETERQTRDKSFNNQMLPIEFRCP